MENSTASIVGMKIILSTPKPVDSSNLAARFRKFNSMRALRMKLRPSVPEATNKAFLFFPFRLALAKVTSMAKRIVIFTIENMTS